MTKITVNADCGKAPKKQIFLDLNIAYARAEIDAVLENLSQDIVWRILGEFEMRGLAEARSALQYMQDVDTRELVVESIITQGAEGAINGLITTAAGRSYNFCDVVQFTSAAGKKIKSIRSYAIDVTEQK